MVFDPFDLTSVEIRFQGRSMGAGIPVVIGGTTSPGPVRGRSGPTSDRDRLPGALGRAPGGRDRRRDQLRPVGAAGRRGEDNGPTTDTDKENQQ